MTIEELQEYKNGKKFFLQEPTSEVVTKLMKEHFSKTESEQLKEWKKAFSYWNVNKSPYKGVHCRKCYGEVYSYLKDNNLLENPSDFAHFEMPEFKYFPNKPLNKELTLWQKFKKIWN